MIKAVMLLFATATLVIAPTYGATATKNERVVLRVNQKCHLRKGVLTVSGDEVHLAPAPNDDYNQIDCALSELKKGNVEKMGFIGNEADPNAPLTRPFQYIAGGTMAALQSLAEQVRPAGWVVQSQASAGDGSGFLTFRTPDGMTDGQAEPFMNRLFKHQLGDITFGPAPTKNGAFSEQ